MKKIGLLILLTCLSASALVQASCDDIGCNFDNYRIKVSDSKNNVSVNALAQVNLNLKANENESDKVQSSKRDLYSPEQRNELNELLEITSFHEFVAARLANSQQDADTSQQSIVQTQVPYTNRFNAIDNQDSEIGINAGLLDHKKDKRKKYYLNRTEEQKQRHRDCQRIRYYKQKELQLEDQRNPINKRSYTNRSNAVDNQDSEIGVNAGLLDPACFLDDSIQVMNIIEDFQQDDRPQQGIVQTQVKKRLYTKMSDVVNKESVLPKTKARQRYQNREAYLAAQRVRDRARYPKERELRAKNNKNYRANLKKSALESNLNE